MSVRVLVRVLRLLFVLVAFQMTEVSELGRALGWFGADTDCCDDCPNDADGKRCPPDCARCHCSHPRASALPARADVPISSVADARRTAPSSPDDTGALKAPHLRGVYRPPEA